MDLQEFSTEFDILYNNIASNQAPGINEYEKSVFLTKAEKQLVRHYFEPQLNKSSRGFDDSIKRQYDFSSLIKVDELQKPEDSILTEKNYIKFDSRSNIYLGPKDVFLTINEQIEDNNKTYSVIPITYSEYTRLMSRPYKYPPKRQAWRLITASINPYSDYGMLYDSGGLKGKVRRRINKTVEIRVFMTSGDNISTTSDFTPPVVDESGDKVSIAFYPPKGYMINYWSLFLVDKDVMKQWEDTDGNKVDGYKYVYPFNSTEGNSSWPSIDFTDSVTCTIEYSNNSVYECIGNFSKDATYKIRYVKTIKPIILTDLSDFGLFIDGYNEPLDCELPEETHEEILQRAVELAKSTYIGDLNSQIVLGSASETNIGTTIKQ